MNNIQLYYNMEPLTITWIDLSCDKTFEIRIGQRSSFSFFSFNRSKQPQTRFIMPNSFIDVNSIDHNWCHNPLCMKSISNFSIRSRTFCVLVSRGRQRWAFVVSVDFCDVSCARTIFCNRSTSFIWYVKSRSGRLWILNIQQQHARCGVDILSSHARRHHFSILEMSNHFSDFPLICRCRVSLFNLILLARKLTYILLYTRRPSKRKQLALSERPTTMTSPTNTSKTHNDGRMENKICWREIKLRLDK